MTKIIAIASQKGGGGKTTIAVHLATAATLAGLDAVVVDLDPQASAASWGGDRGEDTPPEVVSGQASRLGVLLDGARKQGVDLVVIDTGPNADIAARRAAEAADLVLIHAGRRRSTCGPSRPRSSSWTSPAPKPSW
jgi:chromosome partitioning protein